MSEFRISLVYAVGSEHGEARRAMGLGNAFARGGAGGLSFCFGVILLTVCRNVITLLRSTGLDKIIPFDSAVAFHRIVAFTGLFYSGKMEYRTVWGNGV